MPNRLKSLLNIIHDSRWFILNFIGIAKLRWKGFDEKNSHQYLVVTLNGFNHGRYGFQLLNYFTLANRRVVFYRSLRFLLKLRRYDRRILDLPGAILWRKSMESPKRCLPWMHLGIDTKNTLPFPVSLQFLLDLNFFGQMQQQVDCFYLPYFVHPLLGQKFSQLQKNRNRGIRHRILMYGEPNLPVDRRVLNDYFGLIDRSTVFNILATSDISTFTPASFEELQHWINQDEEIKMLCLIDSRKVWIPIEKWIEVLSSFDFFIATPGYCMPHAHNLMEALAVGTIPVLQYHSQLRPPLVPNEDCIAFNDSASLISAVRHVLQLSPVEVASMRDAVMYYYSNHVDPATVVQKLYEAAKTENKLRICFNAEELSLQFLNTGHYSLYS